tara:strand:+ start:215 stop:3649 length:3435 start_codon:yes stop_codon:yes gene_type:complete
MKNLDKLLTASKFKNWLACKFTTINEIKKLEDPKVSKKTFSKTEEIRKQRGDEFEEKIYKEFIKDYSNHIKIKKDKDSLKNTKEALKKGYDLIHKAHFEYDGWSGEIDFLIKGENGYEVYDTKLTTMPKPEHIIQICIYTEWLKTMRSGLLPEKMHLILGDKKNTVSYKVRDYQLYFQRNKAKYLDFLSLKKHTVEPEKCDFCKLCEWADSCEKQWIEEDHLNQIVNTRNDQIQKIKKHGIKTLKAFSQLNESEKIKDLNPLTFKTHLSQAKLLIKSIQSGQPEHKLLEIKEQRGFNKLPKKTKNDIFFDIEGIDKVLNEEDSENNKTGLEYLFGLYYFENDKPKFKYFEAHNKNEEKKALVNLLEFIGEHLKKYPESYIYHYNHYEKTALINLVKKHDTNFAQVNDLLREEKLIDLFHVVKQGMQVSEKQYSLKNLEKHYGFKRVGEIKKANESTDIYLDWVETQEKELFDKIILYNKEDCVSTYELREWLLDIKPANTSWHKEKELIERERNWEKENAEYKKLINKELKSLEIKNILSDILGYHKREDMVYWVDFYNRTSNKIPEQLIENAECIGDMIQAKKEKNEKGVNVYTYKYDEQEFKIKEKDRIDDALDGDFKTKSIGKIINIENHNNLIQIESKNDDLPKNLSIARDTYVNSDPIIEGVLRFVKSAIKKEKKYQATHEILNKNFPNIEGLEKGKDILNSENFSSDEEFLKQSLKIVEQIDHSYLYFQGPPGVGKTHTAAHIILELLKKTKKVGITANSHKVIFNLLSKIEELAVEDNFIFKGFHKPGSDKDKRFNDGKFIKNTARVKVGKTKEGKPLYKEQMDLLFESLEADLFSGTAWCFTRYDKKTGHPACDQRLDYIFIDEASQLSIADTVAISLAAENVIIIGDQMQLGSPTRALHPGESGNSAPQYLLEDKDTIPSNKGIFIEKSRRLHPDVCSFISENFYDSRLKSHEFTKKRSIKFSDKEKLLTSSGIILLDAKHKEISRQKSVEEGEIIKKLFKKIIGSTFIDETKREKIERKITIEDILVVAPYNVQVNYLKSILPEGSKIGTIDKFQGQEAPISIVSMTSTNSESLPRNIDFFFSRNRLNVAISRSQCLSIVIMNKELLETNCKKIEHIKLVNTFMGLEKYEKTFS